METIEDNKNRIIAVAVGAVVISATVLVAGKIARVRKSRREWDIVQSEIITTEEPTDQN